MTREAHIEQLSAGRRAFQSSPPTLEGHQGRRPESDSSWLWRSAIQLLDQRAPATVFGDIVETGSGAIEKVNGLKNLGGEPRRNRTFNPQIKSLLLCQLS